MSLLCLPLNGGDLRHARPVPDSQLTLLLPSSTPHAGCSPPVSSSQFAVSASPEPGLRDPRGSASSHSMPPRMLAGHSHCQPAIFVWGQGEHFWESLWDQGARAGVGHHRGCVLGKKTLRLSVSVETFQMIAHPVITSLVSLTQLPHLQ